MSKEYTVKPANRPVVWIQRERWDLPNGLYYDERNGEIYELSDHPFVHYIGTLPEIRNKQLSNNND